MKRVAALFVETGGAYFNLADVDPWDITRDARAYTGPDPVVAHPPCFLWVNLAAVNWKRYQRERPAWYEGGGDGGCFQAALDAVRTWGAVIEHPAFSWAWAHHGLTIPTQPKWNRHAAMSEWTCEVWQSAYGHAARTRTWLYYVGSARPFDLDWSRNPGTHQVGWFDRIKPTLSKREAIKTPPAFRNALIDLARHSTLEGNGDEAPRA